MEPGTYTAIEVAAPGKLSRVRRPLRDPGTGEARIRVEACGVCHSDSATDDGVFPGLAYPRVPGHEVVGRIEALGASVRGWAIGQRVGVGFLGGSCGYCELCRDGDLVNCRNQEFTGVHFDGVSALRNGPARAGDLVAVVGIGGLGHLGVQYARHMGFEVAAIARGADKAELAKELGAHHYIDSAAADPAAALQALGGAQVVLITAAGGKTVAATSKGLRPGGVSIVLGVGPEPIEVSSVDLVFGSRKLEGALTGNPATGDATLRFSALTGVSPMIETAPLDQAAGAYTKMMAGKARFRMVLTMQPPTGPGGSKRIKDTKPR